MKKAAFGLLLMLAMGEGVASTQAPEAELAGILQRAVELHQNGDHAGAIREYERFLSLGPEDPAILSNLGAAYAASGNYPKAIETYQRALRLDAGNTIVRLNLGVALYKTARLPEAIVELEHVRQTAPSNHQAVLLLADSRFRMNEYTRVIELLEPLEVELGKDRAFIYLLGTSLIREKRSREGQVLIDRIMQEGDSAEARLMLGTAYQMVHDLPAAVQEFQKAVELNPALPGAHALLGQAELATGNREAALQAFELELELNPNSFEANFYRGLLLKQQQAYAEAQRSFQKSLLLRPGALEVDYQIATVHLALGENEKAKGVLEKIVQEAPDFIEAHVSLATVYYRLRMKAEGDRERQIVLDLNALKQATQPGARQEGAAYSGEEAGLVPKPPN